jgi:hypothetical protein
MNSFEELHFKSVNLDMVGIRMGKNPKANLPNVRWYVFPNTIYIPFCNVENLKKIINTILSEQEGIRFKYCDKKCGWDIEYGTIPIERIVTDYRLHRIIRTKKSCAWQAARRAQNIFNIVDDLETIETISIFDTNRWFTGNIWLSYDESKNVIAVEMNRLSGDHGSFLKYIKQPLRNVFKEDSQEMCWLKRCEYLMFVDGIEYDRKNPALKYLCEEYTCREVSSYL